MRLFHRCYSLVLLSFVALTLTVSAQPGGPQGQGQGQGQPPQGIIIGNVIDKKSGVAIEYANVVLLKAKDSTMVNGMVTDKKGSFRLEKVPFGSYSLKVNFIGYKPLIIRMLETFFWKLPAP
jgi:iron complex outermembrane receptor protein